MAVTPWRFGSTATGHQDGDGRVTNPTYALSSDGLWASFTNLGWPRLTTNASGLLRVRNFAFAPDIPTGASITGVEVEIQRSTFADNGNGYGGAVWIKDHSVRLALTTSTLPTGSNEGHAGYWSPGGIRQPSLDAASSTVLYGGPDSLWGHNLTRANVTSVNFAVDVQAVGVSDIDIGYVNFVRARVHYTVGEPPRNVTMTGAVQPKGSATVTQSRRIATAQASGAVVAIGSGSTTQARRSSTVTANGFVQSTGSATTSQTRHNASTTAIGRIMTLGFGAASQKRRETSATMNGKIAAEGSAAVRQARLIAAAVITGQVVVTGAGSASQIVRIGGVVANGRVTVFGSGSVSHIKRNVRLYVEPERKVTVAADDRRVTVSADDRRVTVSADARTVAVVGEQRLVTIPQDAKTAK